MVNLIAKETNYSQKNKIMCHFLTFFPIFATQINPQKMKTRHLLTIAVLISAFFSANAQRIDTIKVHSASMERDVDNIVVTPEQYNDGYAFPVVYLLHGHGDDHTKWVGHTQPRLPQLANQYGVIFVCPDGDTSWYFDSYINPKVRFETYISQELVSYMDSHYKTIAKPGARAITGFSMGGHGALWNAFRHPDVFGACGSLSGGVDFRAFPNNWHIKDHLGEQKDNVERWNQSTALSQIDKIKPGQSIAIDCGVDDFFYPCNVALHEALLKKKIPHDYTIRPGGHSHAYWGNAILYQLVFFTEHFKRNASGK